MPESKETQKLTYGEKRAGVSFNPNEDPRVTSIKRKVADAIDELKLLQDATDNPQAKRAFAVAMTEYETGQMWAVKALFTQE